MSRRPEHLAPARTHRPQVAPSAPRSRPHRATLRAAWSFASLATAGALALAAVRPAVAQTAMPQQPVPARPALTQPALTPQGLQGTGPTVQQPQQGQPPAPAAPDPAPQRPPAQAPRVTGNGQPVAGSILVPNPVPPANLPKLQQPEAGERIVMYAGEVKALAQPGVTRIAIGNGALLKANVVDDRQIVLLADGQGDTTLHLWMRDGRQIVREVTVLTGDLAKTSREIESLLQIPGISVHTVGNNIVIDGHYPNPEAAERIKVLTASFPQIINLIPQRPTEPVKVYPDRMIQMNLRVIEVRKRSLDQLGIRWASTANGPTFATSSLFYANSPWRGNNNDGFPLVTTKHPFISYFGLATQITSALEFLDETGDSWTLAEPQLSCKSGGECKFVAGGEIPIPVQTGFGQTSVVYKQYGVVIDFTPKADDSGTIESGISVEVSEPDPRNSNQGFAAFTTNRTEAVVSLSENSPLVISGLLRRIGSKSSDAIPGLGRLPIIGRLFSSREFTNEQTELMVVVTPRVVAADQASNVEALRKAQQLADDANAAAMRGLAD